MSSQYRESSQPDFHHPIFKWPVGCPSLLLALLYSWESYWLKQSGISVIFLLFLSLLLLAPLGMSAYCSKASLCCSVFIGSFLSLSQSSQVIKTRKVGNHSTFFIVSLSSSVHQRGYAFLYHHFSVVYFYQIDDIIYS